MYADKKLPSSKNQWYCTKVNNLILLLREVISTHNLTGLESYCMSTINKIKKLTAQLSMIMKGKILSWL